MQLSGAARWQMPVVDLQTLTIECLHSHVSFCSAPESRRPSSMSAFRRISSALPLKADGAPAADFRLLVTQAVL
jgi:hypothetical protein